MGSGGLSQRGLFVELTLAFVNPALDEENKIDESDNDRISAKYDALNTLCGLVCVPKGAPHLLGKSL